MAVALLVAARVAASDTQDAALPHTDSLVDRDATARPRDDSSAQQCEGSCANTADVPDTASEGAIIQFPGRGKCAAVLDATRMAPCTLAQSNGSDAVVSSAADTPCCSKSDVCAQSDSDFYCLPVNPDGTSNLRCHQSALLPQSRQLFRPAF